MAGELRIASLRLSVVDPRPGGSATPGIGEGSPGLPSRGRWRHDGANRTPLGSEICAMPPTTLNVPGLNWRSLLLIVVALAAAAWIYKTGPVTTSKEPERPPKLVRTADLRPGRHRISVTADGIVIPARRAVLNAEVTGTVVWQHPALVPGGLLNEGEVLFRVDPTLAELTLRESAANLARIETSLREAERRLAEARALARERLIPDSELAALEAATHLEAADRSRAQATRDRSEELLARHAVRVPFNAVVQEESVEIGQRVDPGFAAATLVGTDAFWVQVALPLDRLPWVRLPSEGRPGAEAQVHLDLGEGQQAAYQGEVVQLLGDLEEAGRMTRVLIRIDDPLGRGAGVTRLPLLLGSYVRVAIDAGELDGVLAVDRTALREGGTLWLMDKGDALVIRPADVRWRQGETVLLGNSLQPGESIIVSDLRVALPGMRLQRQRSSGDEGAPVDAEPSSKS